jgi:hypothetical protein
VCPQPVEPDLAHLAAEVERHAADRVRSGLAQLLEQRLQLARCVVDARDQWRDQDAGADPGALQLRHRLDPLPLVRGVRLRLSPSLLVESRDRQVGRELGPLGDLPQQLQVAK